jgi:hypothetical protein
MALARKRADLARRTRAALGAAQRHAPPVDRVEQALVRLDELGNSLLEQVVRNALDVDADCGQCRQCPSAFRAGAR